MLAGCFYQSAPQNTIEIGTHNNETNSNSKLNEQIGATTTTIKHTNRHYYHNDDDDENENEADLNENHAEGRKLASQATCPRSSSLSSSVARRNSRISWPSRPIPRPRRPRRSRKRRDRPPEATTTEATFSRPTVSAALAPLQKNYYSSSASILFSTATTRALAYSSALVVFLIIIISINDSNHCYCQQISTNHLKARPRSEEPAQAGSKSIFQTARLNDQNQSRNLNQNDPNQRAGRHRRASASIAVLSNKRRRRAELVQFESGAHVSLPRPLAQVARAAALATPEARQQQQDVMPYETFYVTQACEWKSNLFVPKSNDIRFAQQQQQQQHQQPAGWPPPPPSQQPDLVQLDQLDDGSRTILSTSQKALVLALPISLGPGFAGYEPACSIRLIVPRNMRILAKLTARRLTFEPEQIVPSQTLPPLQANYPFAGAPGSFAGADSSMGPARGSQLWLNVSQNQFSETEQRIIETEGNVLAFRFLLERFANKQVPEIRFQVVLTAFQTFAENSDFNQPTNSIAWPPGGAPNQAYPGAQPDGAQQNAQLICDSQRLISANLACDGYKNCQDGHDEEPATCLAIRTSQQATGHTVLNGPATATTTTGLSQHDDTAQGRPSESSGAGQQRSSWLTQLFNYLTRDSSPLVGFLIGIILLILLLVCCACWCHCLLTLLRHLTSGQTVGPEDDEAGRASRSSSSRSDSATRRPLRTAAAEHLSRSSRQQRLRRRLAALRMLASGGGSSAKGRRQTGTHTTTGDRRAELEESDSLARGQNIENTARLKARSLPAGGEPTADQPLVGPTAQQQQQYRIQSILKRPPPAARGEFKGAPLARFEAIPSGQTGLDNDRSVQYHHHHHHQQQQQPLPQPPRTPSRHTTTGGSQHYQQQQQQQPQQQQTPSPRRGALASSMTSAARSSGRFASALKGAGDFRPTPAARATTASAGGGGPTLSVRAGLPAGVRQAQPVAPTPPLDSHQLHESRVPSTTYRSHQQPQARGGGLDDDGRQYDSRQSVVTSRPNVSPHLTDHPAAAGTTTATTPPQQQLEQLLQLQLPPQTPPSASTSDSDRLEFKSKTTKLEQTSTVTGSERVTVYQYSSNLAQFSESYLMKQRHRAGPSAGQQSERAGPLPTSPAHHHQEKAISSSSTITTSTTTTTTRAPQPVSGGGAGGDGNSEPQPPELPPKTRQSSLI